MWNNNAFKHSTCESIVRTLTLSKQISAIQVVPADSAHGKLGLITQLPSGATVDVCGDGFNERTAKIRYGNSYYFAFLQDLEEIQYFSARA